jgi:hypothetical protein
MPKALRNAIKIIRVILASVGLILIFASAALHAIGPAFLAGLVLLIIAFIIWDVGM